MTVRNQQTPLDHAAQLAAETRSVMAKRDDAIHVASRDGFTLREIGDATELAHTTVKRIVDKYRDLSEEAPMKDDWTPYKGRYSQRPETFDAYVDVWHNVSEARDRFTGWVSFSQAANSEPAQRSDRVRTAEECMRSGGYKLGPLTKRGARRWFRDV